MSKTDDGFLQFVLDQLDGLPGVRSRRMFGAHGLYQHDDFFAIVDGGRLYFRTGDATRPDYESRGMKPFAPTPNQVLKNYYEVPVDVLEDDTLLCEWAAMAVQAQRASKNA
jgi:DNA transformation protein